MGRLIDGEWTSRDGAPLSADGAFIRQDAQFRNWITPDGAPGPSGVGGFAAESGRYHLYVSDACPWAHRTLILRKLKHLEGDISVSVVHPEMLDGGWTFRTDDHGATGDTLMGLETLSQVYQAADPQVTSRVTVPVLWDKSRRTIVSNESAEIIRMFNSAFDAIGASGDDYWPQDLRQAMAPVNHRIYHTLNNGVYKCGFARSQAAYDQAVAALFETLDWLEDRLSRQRYLMGGRVTEADWRLFTTLVRFDCVYNGHFNCNRSRIVDLPNLWAYCRELFQWPGIAETVNFDHITRHYYRSHESINPRRIVPIGPRIDWQEPHRRDTLPADDPPVAPAR